VGALEEGRDTPNEGLAVFRLRPPDEDVLLELAAELEASGFSIALSERFSERLAPQLPCLPDILADAEPLRLGTTGVERFDQRSYGWVDAAEERGPGAYRAQLHGKLHGLVTGDDAPDVMRVIDPLSAKQLAAVQAGMPLVAYNPAQQLLSVPIGAELPGLLDRVATLCSGSPAFQRRDSWTTHYPSVPPSVAGQIQRCLGL